MNDIKKILYEDLWNTEGKKPPLVIETSMDYKIDVSTWLRWLDYAPEFERVLMQTLFSKNNSTISIEELQILTKYQKRMRISQLIKKYESDFNFNEYVEIITYLENESIEELMLDKLSQEEKENAKLEIECLNQLPYEELEKKIKEMKSRNLSMVDFYILYSISKISFERNMCRPMAVTNRLIGNNAMLSRLPKFNPLRQ